MTKSVVKLSSTVQISTICTVVTDSLCGSSSTGPWPPSDASEEAVARYLFANTTLSRSLREPNLLPTLPPRRSARVLGFIRSISESDE